MKGQKEREKEGNDLGETGKQEKEADSWKQMKLGEEIKWCD